MYTYMHTYIIRLLQQPCRACASNLAVLQRGIVKMTRQGCWNTRRGKVAGAPSSKDFFNTPV